LVPALSAGGDVTELEIQCVAASGGDWTCEVAISQNDRRVSSHRVGVRAADLARLDPAARDPHVLVDRSFRFLLEREPPDSILREFDLTVIGRYFPEFESAIGRRV
jgi:hypothetical protein